MNVELEIVKLSDEDIVTVSVGGGEGGGGVTSCSKEGTFVDTCDPEME